jgi:hypothetical protein
VSGWTVLFSLKTKTLSLCLTFEECFQDLDRVLAQALCCLQGPQAWGFLSVQCTMCGHYPVGICGDMGIELAKQSRGLVLSPRGNHLDFQPAGTCMPSRTFPRASLGWGRVQLWDLYLGMVATSIY